MFLKDVTPHKLVGTIFLSAGDPYGELKGVVQKTWTDKDILGENRSRYIKVVWLDGVEATLPLAHLDWEVLSASGK